MESVLADEAADVADALERVRQRTWLLVEGLDDDLLGSAATEFLSPPVWDLGHIANFEELWLVQHITGAAELHDGDHDTYDAFAHGRAERPSLELLDREGCRSYMEEVRERTLAVLARTDAGPAAAKTIRDHFVHRMIINHEQQHQETLLQTIQVRATTDPDCYDLRDIVRRLPEPAAGHGVGEGPAWCHIEAGPFTMGRPPGPGIYDNESPQHERDVDGFDMARLPVTVGEYLRFMEDGGYEDQDLWSARGREWLSEEAHHAPRTWRLDDGDGGDQWVRHGPGCVIPVAEWPDVILCHVTHFEAEAYATWAGARLPTESEWEKASQGAPLPDASEANVDQLAFSPSRAGAFPTGASRYGVEHMVGDVWEWTSSRFEPYPGFEAFPYDEYSKVFFGGDYRVLRGGSWASGPGYATRWSRNWDHPYRRQIFSGIRLARDA